MFFLPGWCANWAEALGRGTTAPEPSTRVRNPVQGPGVSAPPPGLWNLVYWLEDRRTSAPATVSLREPAQGHGIWFIGWGTGVPLLPPPFRGMKPAQCRGIWRIG